MHMRSRSSVRLASIAAVLVAALAGCTTVPRDAGLAEVRRDVGASQHIEWRAETGGGDDERVRKMLTAAPLDADTAVAIAIVNSPRVQVALSDLGVARGDLIEAGTVANPIFGAEFRFPADPVHPFELRLAQSLFDLVQLPRRRRIGEAAFEAARLHVTSEILDFAADVRGAYYDLLAASQRADASRTIAEAANIAADLARRQHDAGNIADLELETEQSHDEEAKLRLARDEEQVLVRREMLIRLLGIHDRSINWRIAEAFPPLAAGEMTDAEIESTAGSQRIDVTIARAEMEIARQAIPVARLAAIGDATIDVHLQRDAIGSKTAGPGIDLPLPLFGRGTAATTRAEARFIRSSHRLAEVTLAAESELRIARDRLREARTRAGTYRDVILPRRERIVQQALTLHNAMLAGVYDLLRAKESEAMAEHESIEALHDYWIARVELERALSGTSAMKAVRNQEQTMIATQGGHP
ncbi:MAG TPA: TolC family protein [Thermoanaerobaculia bacterium]|nr:TolC family protein [Thermoanaerobaculia bacterium]